MGVMFEFSICVNLLQHLFAHLVLRRQAGLTKCKTDHIGLGHRPSSLQHGNFFWACFSQKQNQTQNSIKLVHFCSCMCYHSAYTGSFLNHPIKSRLNSLHSAQCTVHWITPKVGSTHCTMHIIIASRRVAKCQVYYKLYKNPSNPSEPGHCQACLISGLCPSERWLQCGLKIICNSENYIFQLWL